MWRTLSKFFHYARHLFENLLRMQFLLAVSIVAFSLSAICAILIYISFSASDAGGLKSTPDLMFSMSMGDECDQIPIREVQLNIDMESREAHILMFPSKPWKEYSQDIAQIRSGYAGMYFSGEFESVGPKYYDDDRDHGDFEYHIIDRREFGTDTGYESRVRFEYFEPITSEMGRLAAYLRDFSPESSLWKSSMSIMTRIYDCNSGRPPALSINILLPRDTEPERINPGQNDITQNGRYLHHIQASLTNTSVFHDDDIQLHHIVFQKRGAESLREIYLIILSTLFGIFLSVGLESTLEYRRSILLLGN